MEGDSPIYLQIIRYVKEGMVAGVMEDGEEMPSRRVLSALLGVNPNTVQKAYRLLEEEGLLVSHAGAKSFLSVDPEKLRRMRLELTEGNVLAAVRAMKAMGLSREEALFLLERLWDRGEETI